MKVLPLHRIAYLAQFVEKTHGTAKNRGGNSPISSTQAASLSRSIDGIGSELMGIGLVDSTLDHAFRIKQNLDSDKKPTEVDLAFMFKELANRLHDDLRRQLCFTLQSNQAKLYETADLFGAKVSECFPRATLDIDEAGKCLALLRGTSTVFHLMRVMEEGLKAVAREMAIPYAPSWEPYLRQIKTKLNAGWATKLASWKRREPFFRDVLAHLEAVKLAWRNPTMHIVNHYSPESAEQVFNAVRGFMQHLAERLPSQERKAKKKAGKKAKKRD